MIRTSLLLSVVLTLPAFASYDGHVKGQYQIASIPSTSEYHPWLGSSWEDWGGELRLNWRNSNRAWHIEAAYQVIVRQGDGLNLPDALGPISSGYFDHDRSNWWQLSWEISTDDRQQAYHRFDRLAATYQSDKLTLRLGRQAVSWGNGLFFNPMDVLNPFDPPAIDGEYKSGADMLYSQYLLDSGDDLQALMVVRRNDDGQVDSEHFSQAVKYHGFIASSEVDLLVAKHYRDSIVGVGWSSPIADAMLQTDLIYTTTDSRDFFSAVAGLSYSWVAGGKNMTGATEYFYSGVGLSGGHYSFAEVAQNEALARRLERGELFTLGRHYAAANVTVELHPLWNLSANVVVNLRDQSAMLQILNRYDPSDNMRITGVLGLPVGPNGTEYGGILGLNSDRFFSVGPSVFAQIAWYF